MHLAPYRTPSHVQAARGAQGIAQIAVDLGELGILREQGAVARHGCREIARPVMRDRLLEALGHGRSRSGRGLFR